MSFFETDNGGWLTPFFEEMRKRENDFQLLRELEIPGEPNNPRALLDFFQDEEKVMRVVRTLKLQSFK